MSTIKTLLDEALQECGFTAENAYAASNSPNAKILLAIANREIRDLIREDWQELRSDYSVTMTTATSYSLPSDWGMPLADTAWVQSLNRRAIFPTSNRYWAWLQAFDGSQGIQYHLRIKGDALLVENPNSGDVLNIEYVSDHGVVAADGTTTKAKFTADTDEPRIDEDVFSMGLVWRIKAKNGAPDTQIAKAEYGLVKRQKLGYQSGLQTQSMSEKERYRGPYEPYVDLWDSNT